MGCSPNICFKNNRLYLCPRRPCSLKWWHTAGHKCPVVCRTMLGYVQVGSVVWRVTRDIANRRDRNYNHIDIYTVRILIKTPVSVFYLTISLDMFFFFFFFFFFLVYQADVSIFYTSNLYWWGKGWPVDGLPFPDTGCPVPDVSIYYMSNINELPDGILFHWFCKCTPPWMFLPLDIPSEYRPEHVTFGLLCVIFKFPSRIFCRRVPGFATDCPCGVWCRGLTTCLLYVGPPLEF